MTYKQAVKLDYTNLCYSQFICTALLYKRDPYRCLYYKSEADTVTLIIFSRTQSGTTVTRHMKFNKAGAENIITRLQNDFDITAEELDEAEQV